MSADDLIKWFSESGSFCSGTKAPHKWVLQAEQELRISMTRIEKLEAENTRLKLALGQIQRRESPDAGKPWRFDEHAGYGENNAPLPPMEVRQ